MSEMQTEYETDAGPTPGPWEDDLAPMDGVDGISILATDEEDNLFAVASVNTPNTGLLEGDWRANARLIAAAGTAAQKAKLLGYHPEGAIRSMPGLIVALQEIADGHEEPQTVARHALESVEGSADE